MLLESYQVYVTLRNCHQNAFGPTASKNRKRKGKPGRLLHWIGTDGLCFQTMRFWNSGSRGKLGPVLPRKSRKILQFATKVILKRTFPLKKMARPVLMSLSSYRCHLQAHDGVRGWASLVFDIYIIQVLFMFHWDSVSPFSAA